MKKTFTIISTCLLMNAFASEPISFQNKTNNFSSAKKSVLLLDSTKQERETPRNVVKLSLFSIPLGKYNLQYEYAFHKNFSAAINVGLLKFPKYITSAVVSDTGALSGLKVSGYSVSPEIRFYPGRKIKKQAPSGFYLAPYFSYSKTNVNATFSFDMPTASNPSVTTPQDLDAKISLSGFTGGLIIGQQWIIAKRVSIDWYILGGGFGKSKLNLDLTQNAITFDANQQAELQKQLDENVGSVEIPGFSVDSKATATANGASVSVSGLPFFSVRSFGLSIGFAF
jgi:hypothetical protein